MGSIQRGIELCVEETSQHCFKFEVQDVCRWNQKSIASLQASFNRSITKTSRYQANRGLGGTVPTIMENVQRYVIML